MMSPQHMHDIAQAAIDAGSDRVMFGMRKRPSLPGFPRGEFVSDADKPGVTYYWFNPHKIIKWLKDNDLVAEKKVQS